MKKDEKNTNLLDMPIWKALVSLAIPIMLTNLLQVAYWLINTFWIWRYSETAFAAMTLAWNVTFLIISFWTWFAIAWSILVAQNFWAKKEKKVNKIAAQSMTSLILIWILLSIVLYFLGPTILSYMWVEWELFNEALSFIQISFIALTFNFAFFMFTSILRWIWEVKLPIYIAILCVALNFILNPLFIFWYSIIPEMWIRWAALSTLIIQIIASVIWFYILFKWNYWIKTELNDYVPDWKLIKQNLKLWIPSSIETVARSLSFVLMTTIVSYTWARLLIQSTLLSAFGAGWTTIQVAILMSIALTQATAVLVWQHAGAGNKKEAKQVVKTVSKISFTMMSIIWVIMFITAPMLINLLIPNNPDVNYYWTQMIRTIALFLWLTWLQMSLSWVIRATWNTKFPMYVTIVWNFLVKLPLAYFLSRNIIFWLDLWIQWIWWSEPIAIIVVTLWMWYWITRINWDKINIVKNPDIIE